MHIKLIEKAMKNKTHLFTNTPYNIAAKVIIESINHNDGLAMVHSIDYGFDIGAKFDNLYSSKCQALNAHRNKSQNIEQKYYDSIHDIKELLQFMLDHVVASAEEYTDYEARNACIKRAKDFGYNIEK